MTDFGLAKAAADEQMLTQSGDIVGTLRYMAPERFEGKSDARGDVYSLGLTLYELLTLVEAFPQRDRTVLLRHKLHGEPPRPRRKNPDVPRDLGNDHSEGNCPRPGPSLPDGERAGGRPAPLRRGSPGPRSPDHRAGAVPALVPARAPDSRAARSAVRGALVGTVRCGDRVATGRGQGALRGRRRACALAAEEQARAQWQRAEVKARAEAGARGAHFAAEEQARASCT